MSYLCYIMFGEETPFAVSLLRKAVSREESSEFSAQFYFMLDFIFMLLLVYFVFLKAEAAFFDAWLLSQCVFPIFI